MKSISTRLIIIVLVLTAAIIYLIPTFNQKIWPYKKINLGLDLQGGMHLVLEVDIKKATENAIENISNELRDSGKDEDIANLFTERKNLQVFVKVDGKENCDKFKKLLDKDFKHLKIASESFEKDILNIVLELPEKEINNIKKMSTEQALETIRNRIDQFGVSEPDIRRHGERQILVQLPGIKDTKRAKELIGKTALLEFKLLDESGDVEKAVKGSVPPGDELLYQIKSDKSAQSGKSGSKENKTPFLVKKRTLLSGNHLIDARVQIDSRDREPYVSIKFDNKGAKIFERITGENVKKRLAIVLDNSIYSAPVIQEKIGGGEARITGNFTTEDAHDLAIALRSGSLPAPVVILEERTVGPSLGWDSIKDGLTSAFIASILVTIFMTIYYRLSGLVADFSLILCIIFIFAGLAAFQATLTLPGIAGIILTIGIAVDANVLIFERIREEILLGKSPHAAINSGYQRASITILDANVTTLIAAVVLFQFGTGPIKGFAVTLCLGVLTSMFTAIIVGKLVFDYILLKTKVKEISI